MTVRRALALYGITLGVLSFAAGFVVWKTSTVVVMDSRLHVLSSTIDVVDHGGPPLLGSTKPYSQPWQTTPGQSYYSAAYTDDPGIYLYLPYAAEVVGAHDPRALMKVFTLGSLALLVCVYPLLVFELFGSVAAALVAPAFFGAFTFFANSDIYWITGWCALLCLPVLTLAATRRWRRLSVAACVGTAFVASYATSVRSEAGLGVAVAALAVVLVREATWRRRLLVGLAVALAYLAIRPAAVDVVEAYRNHEIASYIHRNPGWSNVSSSGHPFWHAAYLGLGYLPNRWGIAWNDSIAAAAVRRIDPNAAFLSPRYSHVLEHLYFKILRTDPWFVARTYLTKAGVELNDALRRFVPGLVLLPVLLAYSRRRRMLRTAVLLTLPTLLIQFAAPVLTLPSVYGVGFLSAVGFLALLAGCDVVALVEERVRGGVALTRLRGARSSLREPRGIVALLAVVALLSATVALHGQHLVVRQRAAQKSNATQ